MHAITHVVHFTAYFLITFAKVHVLPEGAALSGYVALCIMALVAASHGLVLYVLRKKKNQPPEVNSTYKAAEMVEPQSNLSTPSFEENEIVIIRETIRIRKTRN